MKTWKIRRLAFFGLLALILASMIFAVAASNTVPPTRLDDRQFSINANDLKPPECAALNLTAIVVCGGGTCNGNNASELILGSSAIDDIRGGRGNDCILGGGGDDALRGDQNTDVCIGGPGTDTFHPSCETQTQ